MSKFELSTANQLLWADVHIVWPAAEMSAVSM